MTRLEIRNAELTESRRSKSGQSESVNSNEDHPEEKPEDEGVAGEGKEDSELAEEQEEEDEERRGRLSIALTNCGDVLERQLFDAIFWSVKVILIIVILIF